MCHNKMSALFAPFVVSIYGYLAKMSYMLHFFDCIICMNILLHIICSFYCTLMYPSKKCPKPFFQKCLEMSEKVVVTNGKSFFRI